MAEPLDRKSLAERVAEIITDRIRDGEWPDGLPGYRILAARFEVSWRTARKALEILEQQGQLSAPSKGKPRQVRSVTPHSEIRDTTPPPGPPPRTLLVITSSRATLDIAEHAELGELLLSWTSKGGTVQRVAVDFLRLKKPASLLRRMVNDHGAEAILMREAPRAWVDAAIALPLPLFFLGGDVPRDRDDRTSGYSFMVKDAVTDAVSLLRQLGHQRIMIPNGGRGEPFREAVLDGVQAAFGKKKPPLTPATCCPNFPEQEPEAWQRYWKAAFLKSKATAVIVEKETALLSLHGYCSAEGWRIPDDVSVICLAASETLQWFHPPADYMAFPREKGLSLFRQWLHGGLKPIGMRALQVKHAKGGSLRPI